LRKSDNSSKKEKRKKVKLLAMSVLTVAIAVTYLYLQFDPRFDPVTVEQLDYSDPDVVNAMVTKHLKNGTNDYSIQFSNGFIASVDPKIVDKIDDNSEDVVGVEVKTSIIDGTKDYKLHISNELASIDEEEYVKFAQILKNLSCNEVEVFIHLDNLKSERFREIAQEEFNSRCP